MSTRRTQEGNNYFKPSKCTQDVHVLCSQSSSKFIYLRLTALIFACRQGHKECLKLLIDKGADVNAQDMNTKAALRYAVFGNHIDCVKVLIASNCYVQHKDKYGQSALMLAEVMNHDDCARLLRKKIYDKL